MQGSSGATVAPVGADPLEGFDRAFTVVAELAVLRDSLRLLTAEVERVFRIIADEGRRRAALEREVDEARESFESVQLHQFARTNRRPAADAKSSQGDENIAEMLGRRQDALAVARERLAAFNSTSWAARMDRLEAAKARARANIHVPVTASFQGPMMQKALRQGRTGTPAVIAEIRRRAVEDFAGVLTEAAHVATPSDGNTPPVELHTKWGTAVLLTQPTSQVAADVAQMAQCLDDAADGSPATFQRTFARAQDSSTVPHACKRALSRAEMQRHHAAADVAGGTSSSGGPASSLGLPLGDLLPPAKHVLTPRLSAASTGELKEYFSREIDVARTRLQQILDEVAPLAPQSTLTGGRMLRRAARAEPKLDDD